MEYPIIIGGEERGSLRVSQEGLYTVFEAELPGVYDGLYRIWLHGGGRSAYLGLMQPWSGGMYLRKKYSKSAMHSIPQIVERVSDKEREFGENSAPTAEKEPPPAQSCPWPAPLPEDEEGLQWFRREDGSMVSHDGISSLVALPSSLRRGTKGAVLRQIEGREYIVFRY